MSRAFSLRREQSIAAIFQVQLKLIFFFLYGNMKYLTLFEGKNPFWKIVSLVWFEGRIRLEVDKTKFNTCASNYSVSRLLSVVMPWQDELGNGEFLKCLFTTKSSGIIGGLYKRTQTAAHRRLLQRCLSARGRRKSLVNCSAEAGVPKKCLVYFNYSNRVLTIGNYAIYSCCGLSRRAAAILDEGVLSTMAHLLRFVYCGPCIAAMQTSYI